MSKTVITPIRHQEKITHPPVDSTTSLRFGDDQGEVEGVVVGSEALSHMMVRLPPDFDGSTLKEGQPLWVSYIFSGNTYKFESSVLHYLKKFALVFLSYPQACEMYPLRREDRINCSIPATASIQQKAFKGLVNDISYHGCQFIVKIPATFKLYQVSVLTDIDLSLSLSGYADPDQLKGKVRNTNIDEFKIVLGIEFEKLEEQFTQRLGDFIEKLKTL